jgi:NAD(P)-dependent dehydrogenase (short-subunit alcohol dehydrogenase family)
MLIDLSSRTALVTGSTLGIGYAIAAGLHDAGASVVLNSRSDERVQEAVGRLEGGDRVRGVAADVGSAEGCQALIDAVPDVDILVNNAGAFGPQPFAEVPDWKWEKLYAVNVLSGVRLSRHYAPRMGERGWGRVLFISSVDAIQVPANMVDYGATKLAQVALARGLAESLRGTGVTSNSLLVGPTQTEGFEGFIGFSDYHGGAVIEPQASGLTNMEEATEALLTSPMYSGSLISRMANAREVADMAVFLCSDRAAITTGSVVRVDGGCLRGVL